MEKIAFEVKLMMKFKERKISGNLEWGLKGVNNQRIKTADRNTRDIQSKKMDITCEVLSVIFWAEFTRIHWRTNEVEINKQKMRGFILMIE